MCAGVGFYSEMKSTLGAGEAVVSRLMRRVARVFFCYFILQPEMVGVGVWVAGVGFYFEIKSTWQCWRSSSEPVSCRNLT